MEIQNFQDIQISLRILGYSNLNIQKFFWIFGIFRIFNSVTLDPRTLEYP